VVVLPGDANSAYKTGNAKPVVFALEMATSVRSSLLVRRKVEGLLAPKPLLPPSTQLRDAAAAPDEPTAAAPASPSTEETMSQQQLGARGNDRDQHQLLECLRCNFIAHMLSDVHAEHDWQHRSRRD
jgi:hypothetical protein